MFHTFEYIGRNFRIRPREVVIDNTAFWLHYRVTVLLLLSGMAIITTKQFIGEHIACVTHSVPGHIVNTYCFFMATFTVPVMENGSLPYVGVGPWTHGQDEGVRKHSYYQWVPFVLFGQAIAFYLPHYIWKRLEGGRIRHVTEKLRHAAFSVTDCPNISSPDGKKIPTKADIQGMSMDCATLLLEQLVAYRSWTKYLLLCELTNVFNLFLQWKLTNDFLNRQFSDLGLKALSDEPILDVVFPKMSKCTFHKFGPSGTMQKHDVICVLPLNIVNEKTYVILWWWYWVLGVVSVGVVFWRVVQMFLHSRSTVFNKLLWRSADGIRSWPDGVVLTGEFYFCDWLLLYYLASNLDPNTFRHVFHNLAVELTSRKPQSKSDRNIESPLIDRKEK